MRRATIVLVLLLAASIGCIATETGNPTFRPTSNTDASTIDGLLIPDDPMLPTPGSTVALDAGPGSVDPPSGEIWVWNLDQGLPPETTEVAADGSFRITLEAASGELLRVHVVTDAGELASLPLDVIVTDAGLATVDAVAPCLGIDPPVIAFESLGAEVVALDNTCASAVVREPARFQSSTSTFTVEDGGEEIAPGASLSFTVEAVALGEPAVLLVPLTEPAFGLRAVSVFQR